MLHDESTIGSFEVTLIVYPKYQLMGIRNFIKGIKFASYL